MISGGDALEAMPSSGVGDGSSNSRGGINDAWANDNEACKQTAEDEDEIKRIESRKEGIQPLRQIQNPIKLLTFITTISIRRISRHHDSSAYA